MAAPKKWGYTRQQPIGDELLVSWVDGDLTHTVAREISLRLLGNQEDRGVFAAFARASEASAEPGDSRNRIQEPRQGLLDRCIAMAQPGVTSSNIDPSENIPAARGLQLPKPSLGTIAGAGLGLAITALIVSWMLQAL